MCKLVTPIICTLICAILFLVPAGIVPAEEVMVGYEHNIDQRIVTLIPIEPSERSSAFVYKKFLEKRKSHADPERSQFVTYAVRETKKIREIPFLDIGTDDAHAIGRISKVDAGYIIPVIRAGTIELYKYVPGEGTIQRIDLHRETGLSGPVGKVFALANGYIEVVYVGAGFRADYHTYDGSSFLTVDLRRRGPHC